MNDRPSNIDAHSQIDDKTHEYIDYELFTSPDFSPIAFCNSLVTATNDSADTEIDLNSATSRVNFDLEEIEKLLHREAVENHSDLISHASKMTTAESVLSETKKSLDNVTISFQRLESEVLRPYNTALPLYQSLTKIHATSNLLRSLTWYLYLVRQLAIQSNSNDTRSSVRAAKTFGEISRHLTNYPKLRNLKIVTDIENAIRNKDPSNLQ
ncbi:Golgi transport complex subunit 5-domain-containing protein [Dipodascopsis uninucleata]